MEKEEIEIDVKPSGAVELPSMEGEEITINHINDSYNHVFVIMWKEIKPPKDSKGEPASETSKDAKKYSRIITQRGELERILRETTLGLKIENKSSKDGTRTYLLIDAVTRRYEAQAELTEMQVEVKEEYGGGYVSFEAKNKHMYESYSRDPSQFFSTGQRIMLLDSIIENPIYEGGAGLDLQMWIAEGVIDKAYPLHDLNERHELLLEWANWRNVFKRQPLDKVRKYFGEEIALYFGWLGFYTKWLWIASAFGIITFGFWVWGIRRMYDDDKVIEERRAPGVWAIVAYSIFLGFWATFVAEFWKRKNSEFVYEWGMENFEAKEKAMLGFHGNKRSGVYYNGVWLSWGKNLIPVLNRMKGHILSEEFVAKEIAEPLNMYSSSLRRKLKYMFTVPVAVTMLCIVVICNFSVLSLRLYIQLQGPKYSVLGSAVGGVLNALTIIIMSKIWRTIALAITRWENHRVHTNFNDRLIFRTFLFEFVNSYCTLYYIAFFKRDTKIWGDGTLHDTCGGFKTGGTKTDIISNGCIDELTIQLFTLLMTNIIVGQIREFLIPFIISKIKYFWQQKKQGELVESIKRGSFRKFHDARTRAFEAEGYLVDHPGTFDEYSEMIIQFGYITLFASVFPLAPLLAAMNNMVEIRTDALKMLTSNNRPIYRGAQDIGVWYTILNFLGIIAVITNCLLIGLSYDTLKRTIIGRVDEDYSTFVVLATIVVLEHVIFGIKYLISVFIPDISGVVAKKKATQDFIRNEVQRFLHSKKETVDYHQDIMTETSPATPRAKQN